MPPHCTVGLYQACRGRWHFLPSGMYEDCDDDDGDGDDDDFDDDDGVQSEMELSEEHDHEDDDRKYGLEPLLSP